MKCGKLTESVYERSVIKVMKANGAGLRADCAVLAGAGNCAGILSGQAAAFGMDSRTAARAYLAATNHVIACCANSAASGLFDAYANITLMVPERLREIKIRAMIEAAAAEAEETGIPILGCNVQVLPMVTETVAACVISAAMENRSEGNLAPIKKQSLADRDLVMTKWLGLEGTAVIAAGSREKLCDRYPSDLVDTAADFYRYLSVAPEAATAVKSGADYLLALREGGVFGGLWQLAAENGVGLVADLNHIPVRQETIEVCEYFDLNPYELMAGGSLLILASNGGELVRALDAAGVPAAVIGRTTQGNDRIIRRGEESRFLEPANGDEIFRYRAQASGGDTGKIVKMESMEEAE
ncbi:MAG: hydrogenase maturation factor [Lachnospiraceae bacterium]|nr:hydrogenase maturation factor [Lachnospiraceae bacterium]MDE7185243.1 hydrogenase maturation factor [Lachnospiraceae bacterium]